MRVIHVIDVSMSEIAYRTDGSHGELASKSPSKLVDKSPRGSICKSTVRSMHGFSKYPTGIILFKSEYVDEPRLESILVWLLNSLGTYKTMQLSN